MSWLFGYVRVLLFAALMIFGIQIPAVVDQYAKRVDAHYLESTQNMSGFVETAERYFKGDLNALVAHYRKQTDVVFRDDAENIASMQRRHAGLQSLQSIMQQSGLKPSLHVLFDADKALLKETLHQYQYMVLLDPQSLVWGLVIATAVLLVLDLLVALLRWPFRRKPRYDVME